MPGSEEVEQLRADSVTAMSAFSKIAGGAYNPVTGLGSSLDKTSATSIQRGRLLRREELDALYYGDSFIQKAVCLVVKEAYRSWVRFDFSKDSELKSGDFLQYLWRLKFGKGKIAAREAFMQASVLARKDGDAFIIVGVADGQVLDQPVAEDNIETIAWLRVVSRYEMYPEPLWETMQNQEYTSESIPQDALQPTYYRLSGSGQRIHYSRILRFSGERVCDRKSISNTSYYHLSIIQSMYKAYSRWEEGLGYGAALLGDIETYTLGIQGMGKLLQQDAATNSTTGQQALLTRGQSLSMSRSVLKTLLYDLEGELPGSVARSYTGADGIMDRLERAWAASSGTPRWKLFEESGSGGLASSVSSAQILRFTWADIASTWAFENWKDPLDQLSYLVFLAKDSPSKGKIPDEWGEDSAKFPNNISMSKQEQMELESIAANRAKVLTDMGAVSALEIRGAYESGEFSTNITLLPEVTQRIKEQEESQHDLTVQQNNQSLEQAKLTPEQLSQQKTQQPSSIQQTKSKPTYIAPVRESEYTDNIDSSVTTTLDVDDLVMLRMADEDILTCAIEAVCGNEVSAAISKLREAIAAPSIERGDADHTSLNLHDVSELLSLYFDDKELLRVVIAEVCGEEGSTAIAASEKAPQPYSDGMGSPYLSVLELNELLGWRVDDEGLLAEAITVVCGEDFGASVTQIRNHRLPDVEAKTQKTLPVSGDILNHFKAGLLSKADALQLLGYEDPEKLARNLEQEYQSETSFVTDTKEQYDKSLFIKIFTDSDLLEVLEQRFDAEDADLWVTAICDIVGGELAEVLEMRKEVTDEPSWIRAVCDHLRSSVKG